MLSEETIQERLSAYRVPQRVLDRIRSSPDDLRHYHKNTSSARDGSTMLFNY